VGKPPNLLLFNPDEWRGDVLGHLGNPAAVTPNLDRLVARDAVSFRNAFSQSPICVPSRCSFMTGWYPHVRGHRTQHHMLHIERGEPNLLHTLRASGYFVWWGGKNDLVPAQHGYSEHCDTRFVAGQQDYARWGHVRRADLHSWTDWRGEPDSDTYYSFHAGRLDKRQDQIYCDADWANVLGAIDFIRQYDNDRPFCIYLPLRYPHPPYGVEEPWFSVIDRTRLPARSAVPESWEGKPSIMRELWRRYNMQAWSEARWAELRATYYGMCARLDHQLGLVTRALKDKGVYEDTAILFFSDHGDFAGDYSLPHKAANVLQDCLVRVPLIIKPPECMPVQARVSEAMVELVDLAATLYALTGAEPAYTHFGRSLLPIVAGETDTHRDAVFAEGGRRRGERQAMVELGADEPGGLYWVNVQVQYEDDAPWNTKATMCRTQTHKYIRRQGEVDELYDLRLDPRELRNVIDEPEYAAILSEIKERMLTWYMDTCDAVPHSLDQRR
jgi:arylsulfatase A-like enzyme